MLSAYPNRQALSVEPELLRLGLGRPFNDQAARVAWSPSTKQAWLLLAEPTS